MNARGTRRPHARTPRSRDVNISRRGGGGGGGKSFWREAAGCAVLALAVLALPTALTVDAVWRWLTR